MYVEKKKPEVQPAAQTTKQTKTSQKTTNSMYSLLSGLSGSNEQVTRPDEESQSEDED